MCLGFRKLGGGGGVVVWGLEFGGVFGLEEVGGVWALGAWVWVSSLGSRLEV